MTIITEIDLKFKSGNDVQVQDVRLTREEWAQVKAYIDGLSVKPASPLHCKNCGRYMHNRALGYNDVVDGLIFNLDEGICGSCQRIEMGFPPRHYQSSP